jgi:CO/xanthine dehydrogenase Mo-binding subunit
MTIGRGLDRIDAPAKVTGAAIYPGDIVAEGMLHAVVVFTDQPHARLVRLDTAPALSVPGVVEVVTADDIPVNEYGLTMFDQPVLIGPNQCSRSVVPTDVSRWEADQLAVVVAESRDAAEEGAAALATEWDPLPIVADIDDALRDDVLVHPEKGSNSYYRMKIRKGDAAAAWAEAAVVVEGTYELPYQEHAYLQPEAAVSYIDDDGRVTVEIAGQWIHEDQGQIAHALDIPADDIRVI